MQTFVALCEQIDQTASINAKVALMADFFRKEDPDTCAWALFFLSGRKPKQLVGSAKLRQWAMETVGYPPWLMEECYAAVGDTAEMIALILAARQATAKSSLARPEQMSLGRWMTERILPLAECDDATRRRSVLGWWSELTAKEIFMLNKLLTGALRIGVSEILVYRALAEVWSIPRTNLAARLAGDWWPSAGFFTGLRTALGQAAQGDRDQESDAPALLPLPFCLAAPLDGGDPSALGPLEAWQIEWKWDGVRCQIVKAGDRCEIWSRGEERMTAAFPDLVASLMTIPGEWIIDGEILAGAWRTPGSFQALQQRLNRKRPSCVWALAHPVSFLAYDLLRYDGNDVTAQPLQIRRASLERLLAPYTNDVIGLSPQLAAASWDQVCAWRDEARRHGAEGLMLKHREQSYEAGRKRGVWFKWKVDPYSVDAVLTAAQPGSGRRASLYTDYTFSVWSDGTLVPVAKAYSGLTDTEIRALDTWIRQHTIERYGPFRAVEPQRVFELGFEGLARSARHKSGLALRFPRILRERVDKRPHEANQLHDLEHLMEASGDGRSGLEMSAPAAPEHHDSPRAAVNQVQMRLALADEENP